MFRIVRNVLRYVQEELITPFLIRDKPKVFCIGRNKTGTTSLKQALKQLGYVVGDQRKGEKLIREYKKGNFKALIAYCKTAQAFQDVPFSYSDTFRIIDRAFPGSKFILTLRDSPDQWYLSLTGFHAKLFGKGSVPNSRQLKEATYVWKGWMWENFEINYGASEENPYDKDLLISHYKRHNETIIEYFKDRPRDLLVLNLGDEHAYEKFINFLNVKSSQKQFPWENRTINVSIK